MKRINVKLLTLLVVSTLITGVCGYGLYQFQMRRNTEKFWQQAQDYRNEGDLTNARKSLQRYIQYKPEDKGKMITFAKWSKELFDEKYPKGEMEQKQVAQIYGVIEMAIRENPDNKEMRDIAIDFFITARIFGACIPHLEARVALADPDEDISENLLRLSQFYAQFGGDDSERWVAILCEMINLPLERLGRQQADFLGNETLPEGKTLVQWLLKTKANTSYPSKVDAYLQMAGQLVRSLKRPELAEVVVDRMIEVNPNSPLAHLGRARYLRITGKSTREAVISANKALSLPMEKGDEKNKVMRETSDLFIAIGQFSPAKQILDTYAKENPDSAQPYLLYANWAKRQDKFDEAREYIDQGLEQHAKDTRLHRALLNLELDRDSSDGVASSIDFLRQQNLNPLLIDFYQARLDFVNGDTIRSVRELSKIAPDVVRLVPSLKPTVDRTLAKAYTRLGEHDKALEYYKNVLESERDDRTFWGAVKSLLALNQPQSAIKAYHDYGKAKLWETQGNKRVLNEETINEEYPFLIECLETELLSQRGQPSPDWSVAESIARFIRDSKLIEDQKRYTVIANYYDLKGEPQRAEQVRNFMAKENPNSLPLRIQEIQKLAGTDGAAALAEVKKLEQENSERVLAIDQLRIALLLQMNPPDLKDQLLAIENGADGLKDRTDRGSLLKELGRAQLALQEMTDAHRLLTKAVAVAPEDIDARMLVVKLALQRGEDIDSEVDEIQELYGPTSAILKWAQASRIISQVRNGSNSLDALEEANTLVRDGLTKRDNWSELHHLSAEIAMLKGDRRAAIEALDKAIKSGGKNPVLRISLANMLVGEGRPDAAKAYFDSVDRRMWNTQTELVYLNVLSQLGQLPEEIKFDKDSTDTYYHANIGKLALRDAEYLKQLNRSPESIRRRQLFAIDRFRRSVEIEPTLVESWRFLVRALVDIGEVETAQKMIAKAQLEIAEERAHIFLAQVNEIVGNPAEALSHYKSHLQSQPNDVVALQGVATMLYTSGPNKHAEATQYVDRIINSELYKDGSELTARDKEVRAWARRTKAQILSQSQTYHEFDNALSIIEQNQDENGVLPPEDLLLYSRLAASRNDGVSQNKAIAKLEKIRDLNPRPLSRDELVILAELYKMQDRWEECSSIMNSLLGNTPNDMKLLAPWLAWLLEDDQVRLAEKWLENANKESMAYVRTRAHIWVKKGQTKKALELLQPLLPKGFKTPADRNRGIALARYMEQMGEDDPRLLPIVEKIWRKYVQDVPEESLRLAAFLARQDDMQKIDEALQLCGDAIQSGQPQQALQVAVSILRMNQDRIPVGSPQQQLVKSWYDAEEQSNPSASLRIQRSEFDGIMGDFDRAVRNLEKYRTDESVTPQQKAMANNNLAYILALQGEGQQALDLIDESVGILGPISDLLDTRAMAHLALGRNDEALDDLNKAITYGGESAFKLFHLALAEIQAGKETEAKESMRKAKELGLEINQLNLLERKQFKSIEAALTNVVEERTEPVSAVGS